MKKVLLLPIFLTGALAQSLPYAVFSNEFIYGQGSVEVSSQIDDYERIVANKPIKGTIFITHNLKDTVDDKSFLIGDQSLKVTFVKTTQMTPSSQLAVSIYSFQLEGLSLGTHTLPAISVKVGGKKALALPLVIQVSNAS